MNKETKQMMKFEMVTLPEGSWYGDYQVLIKSSTAYELSVKTPTVKALNRIAEDQALVFDINGDKFLKICERYPDYKRFLMTRANLKRAYFIEVHQENRHELMLQTKIVNHKDSNSKRGYGHLNDKFVFTDDSEDDRIERRIVIESEQDKNLKVIRKLILRE